MAVSRPIPALSSICATTSQQPRVVYDSGITVWQVPSNIYSQVSVSYTELEEKIGGTSKLADYLISQMVEWNRTYWPEPIESRSLGDSPAISLMLYPRGGDFHRSCPSIRPGRPLLARRWASDPCRRVGRRPLPARRHVCQDSQVRPGVSMIFPNP